MTPLAIRLLMNLNVEINATNKCASLLIMLHTPLRKELSNDQKFIKEFGEKIGANFNNPGENIIHQLMVEKHINPGNLVVGIDNHTRTYCALGHLQLVCVRRMSQSQLLRERTGLGFLKPLESMWMENSRKCIPKGFDFVDYWQTGS